MLPPLARLRQVAEDPDAYRPLGPNETRVEEESSVLLFEKGQHVWSTQVGRLRLRGEEVEAAVNRLREAIRGRGRRAAVWRVGTSATPSNLVERLRDLGMEAESESGSLALLLTESPQVRRSAFEVRFVRTLEEYRSAIEISITAFGFSGFDAAEERRLSAGRFRDERSSGHAAVMLALDGARPVATGGAWFLPEGLYLGGGATLPDVRGRGAMSALIEFAWEDAVHRGTPALMTLAGAMAAPTLLRIGFQEVARVTHLIDRLQQPHADSPVSGSTRF